jgi:hypothetical protein
VERWQGNCTCGISPNATHTWRRPLRAALNWLARELDYRYERNASALFQDVWAERDAYGTVAGLARDARHAYVLGRLGEQSRADTGFHLLEGERARLSMFGSCAWFFDEVTGHETALMLRLAAFAIGKLGDAGLESEFTARLALADAQPGSIESAADSYRRLVLPMRERSQL